VATLQAFYQAIANHDCGKAVILADGYSVERCQAISNLKLSDSIQIIKKQGNKQILQFSVSYQLAQQPFTTTEATIEVKRINDVWRVDFSSLKALHSKETTVVSEAPKTVETKPESPISTAPLPASPLIQPTGLLSLWTADALQGKTGDEKIHWQRADFSPPLRTEPNNRLPSLNPEWQNSIRRVKLPSNKKWVALTFDLCERADEVAGYDRSIVNTLRNKHAKATFFAGGKWMQSHSEKTQQLMADNNFEIGNHGWTHGNLRVLQGERMQQQIVWTQAEYERQWDELHDKAKSAGLADLMTTVPKLPATLRFPFGTCSPESLQTTNEQGLSAIQWDVVSGDPAITVQANTIVNETRAGSIVIFHANGRGRGTAAALPRIIDNLRAKGFEFVTVSELLAAGTPEAVDECYELKRGDNIAYDAKYREGMVQIRKPKPKPAVIPTPVAEQPAPMP
jgi:peptidoglycan/xylan/chitin deacetylase (PgdA/CDA1 family)